MWQARTESCGGLSSLTRSAATWSRTAKPPGAPSLTTRWCSISNAGQRPLCGMTVAVPPKRGMEIEQLWTMEESEIEDVYDVLWTDYVPPKDPKHGVRYFGLVTKGAAPNVTIDSLSPCLSDYEEDDEEDADLDDDEMESEEEGGAEDAKHGPGRVAKRVVAGQPKPL